MIGLPHALYVMRSFLYVMHTSQYAKCFSHYVMLNLFNLVQIAHIDFVFLLLTRHSMQASSALVLFVGSA